MTVFDEVIVRLRQEVSSLRLVAGAADFAAAMDTPSPPQSPSAWVVPLADSAGANALVGVVSQALTSRVGVVTALRKVTDARGEHALIDLADVVGAERVALLGWAPDADHDPLEFARGQLISLKGGTVWWQDEWATESELRAT